MSEPKQHGFKEHGVMLYLSPEEYVAFIQYQATNKLGRAYAGKGIFNEGLKALNLIDETTYLKNKRKYSQNLIDAQSIKPLTLQELNAKKEHDGLVRAFGSVIEQWELPHGRPNWKEEWLAKAEKYKDTIPQAKKLLDLVAKKAGVENSPSSYCTVIERGVNP
jgi:hypothetical protein